MARDKRNYYQDTPKQIRNKILTFQKIPEIYEAYLLMKEVEATWDEMNNYIVVFLSYHQKSRMCYIVRIMNMILYRACIQ